MNTHNRFGGLFNTSAFGAGVVREGDRYTTPVMRNYKELFEREFGRETNMNILMQRTQSAYLRCDAEGNLSNFVKCEIDRLRELRDFLTGKKTCYLLPATCYLLKECDYLWAHFPDYAGGVAPNCNDISFLNRVRIEIDQMLNILAHIINPC